MRFRSIYLTVGVFLLLASTVLAGKETHLADLYHKHFDQLSPSYRNHLKFLMEDAARALRVFDKYGQLPEETPEGTGAEKKPLPKSDKKAATQVFTAAREIESVAAALQRAPLPPSGHWLKVSQHLKIPAVSIKGLPDQSNDERVRDFVAKARGACYECHRVYGGPLDQKALLGQGPDEYEKPDPLPPTSVFFAGKPGDGRKK